MAKRLKEESVVDDSLYVETEKFPGKCRTKSETAIKAASHDFDKIVIIVDAEGSTNRDTVFKEVDVHIREEIKSKVGIVILDYMIEEWICYSYENTFWR